MSQAMGSSLAASTGPQVPRLALVPLACAQVVGQFRVHPDEIVALRLIRLVAI